MQPMQLLNPKLSARENLILAGMANNYVNDLQGGGENIDAMNQTYGQLANGRQALLGQLMSNRHDADMSDRQFEQKKETLPLELAAKSSPEVLGSGLFDNAMDRFMNPGGTAPRPAPAAAPPTTPPAARVVNDVPDLPIGQDLSKGAPAAAPAHRGSRYFPDPRQKAVKDAAVASYTQKALNPNEDPDIQQYYQSVADMLAAGGDVSDIPQIPKPGRLQLREQLAGKQRDLEMGAAAAKTAIPTGGTEAEAAAIINPVVNTRTGETWAARNSTYIGDITGGDRGVAFDKWISDAVKRLAAQGVGNEAIPQAVADMAWGAFTKAPDWDRDDKGQVTENQSKILSYPFQFGGKLYETADELKRKVLGMAVAKVATMAGELDAMRGAKTLTAGPQGGPGPVPDRLPKRPQ